MGARISLGGGWDWQDCGLLGSTYWCPNGHAITCFSGSIFGFVCPECAPAPVTHDPINSPPHYKTSKTEAIDAIEAATMEAPDGFCGYLQGNCIKYLIRMWRKGHPSQDADKALWYLNRLIAHIRDSPV